MALLLEELGWPDVVEYLRHDDRLILVVGSTEQHGRHLTFATDVWQPWEIARRVSDQTGVLVAPPVNYGMSLHHLGFPGSLSLRPQTLSSIIADLLESAYGHGFRRILILNGHGGNVAAIQVWMTSPCRSCCPGRWMNFRFPLLPPAVLQMQEDSLPRYAMGPPASSSEPVLWRHPKAQCMKR